MPLTRLEVPRRGRRSGWSAVSGRWHAARLIGLWLALSGLAGAVPGPDPLGLFALVDGPRMMADVERLSTYNGRQSGTTDDHRSAVLVADRFEELGLVPGGSAPLGPGARPWAMTSPVTIPRIAEGAALSLGAAGPETAARLGEDFLPILDSPSVDLSAGVVFVGYGLVDPDTDIDDYAGVDVRDQVVLFLRGAPEGAKRGASHAEKVRVARDKGAAAYLTATGPIVSGYEARRGAPRHPLAFYAHPGAIPPDETLPGAWISTALAERLVGDEMALRDRQAKLNQGRRASTQTPFRVRLSWAAERSSGALVNVVGRLLGGSEERSGSAPAVIVGAHRDHFGRQAGLLFQGADDNASGSAVILEVARVLARAEPRPRRPIVFVSFSGEEQGLLGSRAYVSAESEAVHRAIAMVNVDHAGIGNGRLTIGLQGIEKAVALRAAARAGLSDRVDVFGYFPGGDHVPFKEVGVPTVAVVTSGPHPHFHRPTDRPETIQPEALVMTARYLVALLLELADGP